MGGGFAWLSLGIPGASTYVPKSGMGGTRLGDSEIESVGYDGRQMP